MSGDDTGDELYDVFMARAAEGTVKELKLLREAEKTATTWMIRLTAVIAVATIVLVALTYSLVAEAFHWWPFA